MNKIVLLLLPILIFFTACNTPQNDDNEDIEIIDEISGSDTEDKVLQAITKLPEYYDAEEHVKAITNGKQSLSSIIYPPDKENSDYYIQVGYNQETWFEPYYHFYVNPKTFEVFIEDMIEGDIIPIEVWRKREENR